jgi:hypothetical protein
MSDVFLKIIGVILAVVLLVVAPALIVGMVQDLTIQRSAMNSTENFLDVVRNSGRITASDYTDFVSDLHALGVTFDVHIVVEQEVIYPTEVRRIVVASLRSTHDVTGSFPVICRKGDFVTVSVIQTSRSSGQRFAANTLRTHGGFRFSLSGAVRN